MDNETTIPSQLGPATTMPSQLGPADGSPSARADAVASPWPRYLLMVAGLALLTYWLAF